MFSTNISPMVTNCKLINAGKESNMMEEEEESVAIQEDATLSQINHVAFRVLLVEADDCTRQIISALLRKCNYRGWFPFLACLLVSKGRTLLAVSVLSFSDGLIAWETLKRQRCHVDIALIEAEMPSISGYTFLTLMTEDDACKKIPVIMMSAQCSFETVMQCISRGAVDFLVKPIRKNELKNLWVHVWRRRTLLNSLLQGEVLSESSMPSDHSCNNLKLYRCNTSAFKWVDTSKVVQKRSSVGDEKQEYLLHDKGSDSSQGKKGDASMDTYRSSLCEGVGQREAAVMKYRQKRKERCFEKEMGWKEEEGKGFAV